MDAEFIPLRQACRSSQGVRAEDAPTHAAAATPFVPARKTAPTPATPGASADGSGLTGDPEIIVDKDGDRITHIRICCTCGQVTEIECGY